MEVSLVGLLSRNTAGSIGTCMECMFLFHWLVVFFVLNLDLKIGYLI